MQWTDVVEAFLTAVLLASLILGAAFLFGTGEQIESDAERKQSGD